MPGASPSSAAVQLHSLTSRDNRWLKRFRAALRGAEPDADGCIGIEGPHLVEEALRLGLDVPAILCSASGEHHLERLVGGGGLGPATQIFRTSDRLFDGVADTRTPQGIAALVRPRAASFDELLRGVPLVVVLVEVQDPGNVGTILRSAEAFGATGAATTRGTANPLAPKALRASASSALRLPLLAGASAPILLAQFRAAGVKTFAASTSRGLAPSETDFRAPVALLIGNEGAGLPPEVERSADAQVRIPVVAPVESLNAAVAASVLLYEAARQRVGQK